MSDTTDLPDAGNAAESPDRRSLLKKAGIVGVGVWAAPVVTSLTSPAYADGSPRPDPDPDPGDDSLCPITVDVAGTSITVTIVSKSAFNSLEFGVTPLGSPCTNCATGDGQTYTGSFPVGFELRPFLVDHGNNPGTGTGGTCSFEDCNTRFECTNSQHVAVVKNGPNDYSVYTTDAGCGCTGNNSQAGPGVSNLTAHITIT